MTQKAEKYFDVSGQEVEFRFIYEKTNPKNFFPDVDLSVVEFDKDFGIVDSCYFNNPKCEHCRIEENKEHLSYSAFVDLKSVGKKGINCFVVNVHSNSGYFENTSSCMMIATTSGGEKELFTETIDPSFLRYGDPNLKTGSIICCLIYLEKGKWTLKRKFRKIPFSNTFFNIQKEMLECQYFLYPKTAKKTFPAVRGGFLEQEENASNSNPRIKESSLIELGQSGLFEVLTSGYAAELILHQHDGAVYGKKKPLGVSAHEGKEEGISNANSVNLGDLPPEVTYFYYHLIQKLEDRAAQENKFFCVVEFNGSCVCRFPLHHIGGGERMNAFAVFRGSGGKWFLKGLGGRKPHVSQSVWSMFTPEENIPQICFKRTSAIYEKLKAEKELEQKMLKTIYSKHVKKDKFYDYYVVSSFLPKMDVIGSCDGYFLLYNLSNKKNASKEFYKSDIVEQNRHPEFRGKVPYSGVKYGEKVLVKVYDWDKMTSDDYIGKFELDWQPIGCGGGKSEVQKYIELDKSLDKNYKNVEMKPELTWRKIEKKVEYQHDQNKEYATLYEQWVKINRDIISLVTRNVKKFEAKNN